jgi:hypothetical protein
VNYAFGKSFLNESSNNDRIVAANEGHTTADILQLIKKSEAGIGADEATIFGEMKRFYAAAKESGQMLLRSGKVAPFPLTQNRQIFRIEFL